MIERLRFPLGVPQFRISLPPSCTLEGVEIENDISFLRVEHPEGFSIAKFMRPESSWTERAIRIYMEGEEMELHPATEDKPAVKMAIPIPATGATLHPGDRIVRLLGVLRTIGAPATWHIFEILPKPKDAKPIQNNHG